MVERVGKQAANQTRVPNPHNPARPAGSVTDTDGLRLSALSPLWTRRVNERKRMSAHVSVAKRRGDS